MTPVPKDAADTNATGSADETRPAGGTPPTGLGSLIQRAHEAPYLTAEEERDLLARAASGDAAAVAALVDSHMRLVFKIARTYTRFGMPLADLAQEGLAGLVHAVNRFNPEKEVRLATYAMWWVRASIQDYVAECWPVMKVPRGSQPSGTQASAEAPGAGAPPGETSLIEEVGRCTTAIWEGAEELGGQLSTQISNQFSTGFGFWPVAVTAVDEDGSTLAERLPSDDATPEHTVVETTMAETWSQLLDWALSMLPEREAWIIRQRHFSELVPTFESLGRDLGISKDRARQLEKRGLERLHEALAPLAESHGLPAGFAPAAA